MDNKEMIRYFYKVVVSENLLEELSQYISESYVLKIGDINHSIRFQWYELTSWTSKKLIQIIQ